MRAFALSCILAFSVEKAAAQEFTIWPCDGLLHLSDVQEPWEEYSTVFQVGYGWIRLVIIQPRQGGANSAYFAVLTPLPGKRWAMMSPMSVTL